VSVAVRPTLGVNRWLLVLCLCWGGFAHGELSGSPPPLSGPEATPRVSKPGISAPTGKCSSGESDASLAGAADLERSADVLWRRAIDSFQGRCGARNYGKTLAHLQQAALAGNACALGAWGLLLGNGWGTARDLVGARERLVRSGQSGCRRAGYWAWWIDAASAQPAVRERALVELEASASQGDGHALNALGTVRERMGERSLAADLYQRSAAAGNGTARQNLARLARMEARSGARPSVADLGERAKAGEPQAQYLLARRLHQGDGVATNYALALGWYQKAAQQGQPAAREMLILIHARLAPSGGRDVAVLRDLALVELRSDEVNKARGIKQPIEDEDPLAGL
jgi:TPR repeat protein